MRPARRVLTAVTVVCCLWGLSAPLASAATPSPSTSPSTSPSASPSASPSPCAGAAQLVAQTFTPASVAPGGQSREDVTLRNCGSAALTLRLQWTARWTAAGGGTGIPAGCAVFDPLPTTVTIPAGGRTTSSLTYTVPASCTAVALTGSVSSTDGGGLSGSAVLAITGSNGCAGAPARISAQSFTPASVSPGGSATESVTVQNCGSTPLTTRVQWTAFWAGGSGIPAGCFVYDPVLTTLTVPANGSATATLGYSVPASCTATGLTASVSLPDLPTVPAGSAVLTITRAATCTAVLAPHVWLYGFSLGITLTNQGAPVTGWTARYTFPGDEQITISWNATITQSGATVTATNAPWNATLATGAAVGIGSNGTWHTSSAMPTSVSLNGQPCTTTTAP